MTIGTFSPSTLVGVKWIIPRFREFFQHPVVCHTSPEFHQLDSSWYLSLYFDGNTWMWIHLCRRDSGPPKTIKYNINIKGKSDVVEITKTVHFSCKGSYSGKQFILEEEAASNSDLIITCYIECETPLSVEERKFVSSAVQTEVANSVTAKEGPNDEDWSPLDMKGVALLSERMKELLIKGIDHDVTICVQDKEFRAHRSILSARSPVFAMMLTHDTKEKNTSTINIEDCDPESFNEFLLYVYSGRTENLPPGNALGLYYPADKYDFPILKEWCVNVLIASLSVSSICDVVLLAAKHQEKELLEVATEFFARNVKKILVTVGWQNFLLQNPVEANELYIKSMEILLPEN